MNAGRRSMSEVFLQFLTVLDIIVSIVSCIIIDNNRCRCIIFYIILIYEFVAEVHRYIISKECSMNETISILNHAIQRGSMRAVVPYNAGSLKICRFLYNEGYLSGYNSFVKFNKKGIKCIYLDVYFTYHKNRPVLGKIFRISHMGHHRYFTCDELRRRIAQDRIFYVISTNKGWLSIYDCVKFGVGGEFLFGVFS